MPRLKFPEAMFETICSAQGSATLRDGYSKAGSFNLHGVWTQATLGTKCLEFGSTLINMHDFHPFSVTSKVDVLSTVSLHPSPFCTNLNRRKGDVAFEG